jgi:NAD(P)-dependent dehydrogenase (short-subunit alcohol dehydrogenase family)
MSEGKLKNKTAWISGGTKGIGEGAVRLFVKEGANVAFTGRSEDDGKRLENEMNKNGRKVLFIKSDMTKADEIEASINKAVEMFGGLQILINNAGTVQVKALHEYTEEDWDYLMDLNVKSMFLAFKYAFSHLSQNDKSYVVNIGSISSFVGQNSTPVYTTSKGAVLQLSRSIGLDYARYGIRSNCVCPGITDTPLLRYHLNQDPDPEGHLEQRLRRVPMGRALTIEDVAKSILFFSCEDSAGVTATSLIVDGGYLAAAEWDTDVF